MHNREFGIHLPNMRGYTEFDYLCKIAKYAESNNFNEIWISDHILYPLSYIDRYGKGGLFEVFTTMSSLTQITSTIRLGTSVFTPIRNPILTAVMATTIDHASNGRTDFGFGIGWYEKEFTAFGFKLKNRKQMMNEQVDALISLWTQNNVNFRGHNFSFDDITIIPKPIQKPHPPLFFGTSEDYISEKIQKFSGGWIPFSITVKEFIKGKQKIESICDRIGKNSNHIKYIIDLWTIIEKTSKTEEYTKQIVKSMDINMNQDERKNRCLIGGIQEIQNKIGEYFDAGANQIVFMFPPIGNEFQMMDLVKEYILH